MATSQQLVEQAQIALNEKWGYIWGMVHVMWSEARQKSYNEKYKDDPNRQTSIRYGSRWYGHWVTDCAGLCHYCGKECGVSVHQGSNLIWECDLSSRGQLKAGKKSNGENVKAGSLVFVYKAASKKRTHVGIYAGNGVVIEAAGTKEGVITSKITDSKWTDWGELKGVDYSGAPADPVQPEPVKPEPAEEEYPTIRKGSKGKWVTLAQVKLIAAGYSCGPQGADGDFGSNTEKAVKLFQKEHTGPDGKQLTVDGVIGRNTWWALEASPQRVTYTVTIRNLTADQKNKLMKEYPGAETKMEN